MLIALLIVVVVDGLFLSYLFERVDKLEKRLGS